MHSPLVFTERLWRNAFVEFIGVGESVATIWSKSEKALAVGFPFKRRRTTFDPPAGTSRT